MSFASNCVFFLAASVVAASTQAVAAPAPEFGPNPAVSWVGSSGGFFLPPDSGAGPMRQDPAHPYVGNDEFRETGRQPTMPFADLTSPILQPWTRAELQKRNELVLAGKAPTLGIDCGPTGAAAFLLWNVQPYFFVQAPDKVLIINQQDHQFRHIYLTAEHSRNPKPSWSGESIGHYEGGELVVDTIAIAGKAPVDRFFTPHTDQLHLIERFRLASGGDRLEVRLHFEDPGAFTMPWDARVLYQRVEPGRAERVYSQNVNSGATEAGPLLEKSCAENPFSYFGSDGPPVRHAEKPDF
jgi:hypothetical protein